MTGALLAAFVADVSDEVPNDLRFALTLVSIASFESRFAPFVADGSCNRADWRKVHGEKWCDEGIACGFLQMHLDEQKRPGDPSCRDALEDAGPLYVQTAARWLRETPFAWSNIAWHRARVREELAR